ncbi:hypothetical protein BDN72DRAFT_843418 [Pluteus cervinus]|uniref:Uncharacterized protein n=1 Tax=Pluteus cervinus TaxID=181527 RepID=A0ACD3AMM3_9AGAR|nr:hypothetical protein BDN72DRAFT_843418 [Pluteus cervinus]
MFALQNEVTNPADILLVAKRVHDWCVVGLFVCIDHTGRITDDIKRLTPHMYKTLVMHPGRIYPPNISFASVKRHGHHTRHLLVKYEEDVKDRIVELLSYCPNICNLALWGDRLSEEVESVLNLDKITHLSIDLVQFKEVLEGDVRGLVTDKDDDPDRLDKLAEAKRKFIAFFSRITHLEIPVEVDEVEDVATLKYFTSLTHLCVPVSIDVEALQHIVLMCQGLEVLVLLATPDREDEDELYFEEDMVEVVQDVDKVLEALEELVGESKRKIVPILCSQFLAGWEHGVRGGQDMWTLADKVVRGRQRKDNERIGRN